MCILYTIFTTTGKGPVNRRTDPVKNTETLYTASTHICQFYADKRDKIIDVSAEV